MSRPRPSRPMPRIARAKGFLQVAALAADPVELSRRRRFREWLRPAREAKLGAGADATPFGNPAASIHARADVRSRRRCRQLCPCALLAEHAFGSADQIILFVSRTGCCLDRRCRNIAAGRGAVRRRRFAGLLVARRKIAVVRRLAVGGARRRRRGVGLSMLESIAVLLGSTSRICAAAGSGDSARPSDAVTAKTRRVIVFRMVDPTKSCSAPAPKSALNHDSASRAGNEPAMTRVEITPDRIDLTTKCPSRRQKCAIFGVAGREVHGYSDPPRPDCR